MPPEWFSLLQYQRARGKTGLTIPFLIGVRYTMPLPKDTDERENAFYKELTSLLLSFRDATPSSHWVIIAEWDLLLQPVVAVYPPGDGRTGREGLADTSGAATRMYVEPRYFHGKERSIESANEGLWKRVGDPLMRREFSFRDGHYARINSGDREFIENARRWWASRPARQLSS